MEVSSNNEQFPLAHLTYYICLCNSYTLFDTSFLINNRLYIDENSLALGCHCYHHAIVLLQREAQCGPGSSCTIKGVYSLIL